MLWFISWGASCDKRKLQSVVVVCLSLRVGISQGDVCVWRQLTMCCTHSYPSRLWTGCKGLCNWSCLTSLSIRGISVGTREFFWCNKNFYFSPSRETKGITACGVAWTLILFASLSSEAQATFHESSVFNFKTKSIDTGNLLCVCEDINFKYSL